MHLTTEQIRRWLGLRCLHLQQLRDRHRGRQPSSDDEAVSNRDIAHTDYQPLSPHDQRKIRAMLRSHTVEVTVNSVCHAVLA